MFNRRSFLGASSVAAAGFFVVGESQRRAGFGDESIAPPPAFSVDPVVGDGKWIWTEPPAGSTGFLEPRRFQLRVGIDLTGRGAVRDVFAMTPVPVLSPEQQITVERTRVDGSEASLDPLGPFARQLRVYAPALDSGSRATAVAEFELTISKQYFGYEADDFPAIQKVPTEARTYLGDSPGIETRTPLLVSLFKELSGTIKHPWHLARAFNEWIPRHIRPRLGTYTSVKRALETKEGDCEEMAGLFVALCRAAGIPARLVWIPNHVWSEFFLVDRDGAGHWIPAHTACYHWFGWTGAHELVIQKGDRIHLPDKNTNVRLQTDRLRWLGIRPEVRYWAELTPLAEAEGSDPGPGARRKIETGEWINTGPHAVGKYVRR